MTTRKMVLATSLIAILLITSANWVFAHGGDISLIHACVKNNNGLVRIVGPNDNCLPNEQPLDWPNGSSSSSGYGSVFTFLSGAGNCPDAAGNREACEDPWTEIPFPRDGQLTRLVINPYENTSSNSVTVTVFVNDAPTTLSLVIPAGSLDQIIFDANVNIQAGDLVQIQADMTANPGEELVFTGALEYRAD